MSKVKGLEFGTDATVAAAVDQAFHLLALFSLALLVGD
jgi:hypothetical protein